MVIFLFCVLFFCSPPPHFSSASGNNSTTLSSSGIPTIPPGGDDNINDMNKKKKDDRYILLTYKPNNIAPFILFNRMKHGMPIDKDATKHAKTNIKSLVRPFVGRTKLMARLIRLLADIRFVF